MSFAQPHPHPRTSTAKHAYHSAATENLSSRGTVPNAAAAAASTPVTADRLNGVAAGAAASNPHVSSSIGVRSRFDNSRRRFREQQSQQQLLRPSATITDGHGDFSAAAAASRGQGQLKLRGLERAETEFLPRLATEDISCVDSSSNNLGRVAGLQASLPPWDDEYAARAAIAELLVDEADRKSLLYGRKKEAAAALVRGSSASEVVCVPVDAEDSDPAERAYLEIMRAILHATSTFYRSHMSSAVKKSQSVYMRNDRDITTVMSQINHLLKSLQALVQSQGAQRLSSSGLLPQSRRDLLMKLVPWAEACIERLNQCMECAPPPPPEWKQKCLSLKKELLSHFKAADKCIGGELSRTVSHEGSAIADTPLETKPLPPRTPVNPEPTPVQHVQPDLGQLVYKPPARNMHSTMPATNLSTFEFSGATRGRRPSDGGGSKNSSMQQNPPALQRQIDASHPPPQANMMYSRPVTTATSAARVASQPPGYTSNANQFMQTYPPSMAYQTSFYTAPRPPAMQGVGSNAYPTINRQQRQPSLPSTAVGGSLHLQYPTFAQYNLGTFYPRTGILQPKSP